jgi:hypothetical protein
VADQDAEGEARDERDRAAAGHDRQRPGTLLVAAEDAGRAVGGGLVPGRAKRGEHPAGGDGGEIRSGGLNDHAGDEDGHARREQCPPVPGACRRGDDR